MNVQIVHPISTTTLNIDSNPPEPATGEPAAGTSNWENGVSTTFRR